MFRLFFRSLIGYLRLGLGCASPRARFVRWSFRRLVLLAVLFPLFVIFQLWQWLGLFVDELLFRGYRQIDIQRPLFILGAPRSGTTFVHRSLAQDEERFTTFKTWEALFAHSISARYLILGLARIDRACGRPLGRVLVWLERLALARLDAFHPMTLDLPEEDYLALTTILACFILIVPFPFDHRLWRLANFDVALDPAERRRILRFYEACLRRHMYVFGKGRRLLSKNAAFASWIQGIAEYFPDAQFIVCERAPVETVPSLLSSMQAGLRLFDADCDAVQARLVDVMAFYYQHLPASVAKLRGRRVVSIEHETLRKQPKEVLLNTYRDLGFTPSRQFLDHLNAIADRHSNHHSGHRYSLSEFGLSEGLFAQRFTPHQPNPCETEAA